uniref:Secreted protein n=1 Tax=Ixodes ricinus TaxID=34613 RepID=V5GFE8_IXORI
MITRGSALWRRVWLLKFGASAAAVAPRQSWRRMFMLERRVTNSLPLSFVNFSVRRSFVMKRVMEASDGGTRFRRIHTLLPKETSTYVHAPRLTRRSTSTK